jgi:glutamine amidotransferase
VIAIIDYGAGNIASIVNMLKRLGYAAVLSSDPAVLEQAERLILPGVGHFDYGMEKLEHSGIVPLLNRRVLEEKIPILGICLGLQLFTKRSDEGVRPGLGWIDAETIAFNRSKLSETDRIPHMGWSTLQITRPSRLFSLLDGASRFYFVHSFHLQCRERRDVIGQVTHGYPIDVAVERGNIFGVQFHPEKSHRFGMEVLRNFVNLK